MSAQHFVLLMHPTHAGFIEDHYLPFMQDSALVHEIDETNTFMSLNVDPKYWLNPMMQAIATTYLFLRLSARTEGKPWTGAPDGLLDMIFPFHHEMPKVY